MNQRYTLHHGDCIEVMRTMPDNSVDSIVTDPPYGIEFMGKEWDAPWKRVGEVVEVTDEKTNGIFASKGFNHGVRFSRGAEEMAGFQLWCEQWAKEALRVLKPGGHLLAFSGSRTYHRMAVAIEDAGFEIRDQIMWIYGSGFPKSLDVSKAIDKKRDDSDPTLAVTRWLNQRKRESGITNAAMLAHFGFNEGSGQIGHWTALTLGGQPTAPTWEQWLELKKLLNLTDEMDAEVWRLNGRKGTPGEAWEQREVVGSKTAGMGSGETFGMLQSEGRNDQADKVIAVTAPATPAAQQWAGWGTALKPAHEPIVVARKPLAGTVAANVLAHGVGALNIDACRVGRADGDDSHAGNRTATFGTQDTVSGGDGSGGWEQNTAGRWPANVIHDGSNEVVALFPDTKSPAPYKKSKAGWLTPGSTHEVNDLQSVEYGDSGSAARFFYCAKANKRDRNEGLEGFAPKNNRKMMGNANNTSDTASKGFERFQGTPAANNHPTVKPTDLMRYLIRLVTPQGATILDPFMGSGSTGKAAMFEGVNFIGIEQDAEYLAIAKARIEFALNKPAEEVLFPREEPTTEQLVTDDQQLPLFTQDTA